MKKLVILTGAGMSAESGIKTFRGTDGLWEGHNIMEVASPEEICKKSRVGFKFLQSTAKTTPRSSSEQGTF
jgi:NAD-dependent deacetylase